MTRRQVKSEQEQLTLLDLGTDAPVMIALPASEAEWVEKMKAGGMSPRFWEVYAQLRMENFPTEQAIVGAWHAVGRGQRGKYPTLLAMSVLFGVDRRRMGEWLRDGADLRVRADAIRGEFWAERVADVDENLYRIAITADATAAHIQLVYKRAGINTEEAEQSGWLQALQKAEADSKEE